jgi:hypothetical protein
MTGWLIYLGIVFFMSFLYVLNLYLRGRWRKLIEGILSLILLALIILSFFVFNWKYGLLTLICSLLALRLLHPIAKLLAHKTLGYRTGIAGISREEQNLNKFSKGKMSLADWFESSDRAKEADLYKLNKLLENNSIKQILDKYEVTLEDLYEHYRYISDLCSLDDLSWDIITTPNELEKYLQMRKEGKNILEINMAFRRGP